MNQALTKFKKVMEKPNRKQRLAPGASSMEIAEFKQAVGLSVPESFIQFIQFSNGTTPKIFDPKTDDLVSWEQSLFGDQGPFFIYSLDKILNTKKMWDDFAQQFQASSDSEFLNSHPQHGYWNPKWIPFADNASNELWAIATEPCFEGPAGQVIWFDYSGGSFWRTWFQSFDEWILAMADLVENEVHETDFVRREQILRKNCSKPGFVTLPNPPSQNIDRFHQKPSPWVTNG